MNKSNINMMAVLQMIALPVLLYAPSAKGEIIGQTLDRVADEAQMVAALNTVILTDNSGASIQLNKYIGNGKPTLVTIWEKGCINCLVEMRGMEKIAKKCPDSWNILYVSIARENFDQDYIRFKKYKLPWSFYHLGSIYFTNVSHIQVRKAFFGETHHGVIATPLHYLISKNGTVDAVVNAKINFEETTRLAAFCAR